MGETLGLGALDVEAAAFLRGIVTAAPDQSQTFAYLRGIRGGARQRVGGIAEGLTEAQFQTRAERLRTMANRAIGGARRDIVSQQSQFPQVRARVEQLVGEYVEGL
ncbi:MAG: hypothetical protein GTO63_03000, partial [Anaerolineae bacterium]|nr:hypothetical protein [Anaerolineae bacterium]NIN93998.1 hypothetical protein [Anaerolineae bacterium]NIQ77027.1 hypothetical protein [Anaerolineae bacterium]